MNDNFTASNGVVVHKLASIKHIALGTTWPEVSE